MRYYLSSLMRYHSSSLMRYHSSSLMRYRSSDLMRCFSSDLIRYSSSDLTRYCLSSLMSRFRQVWWVAFVRLDESSRQDSVISKKKKIELDFVRHLEKIRVEQSKHRRWDDQAWSRERIYRNTFYKREKVWSRISRSHLTFRDKTQKHVINIFTTSRVFREKHS
jgi:hypothetical protein